METDRRRYPRLATELAVRVVYVGGDSPEPSTQQTVSKNVSGGGIRAAVDRALDPGAFVGLSIDLPGRQDPAEFFGQVVWCEPQANGRYDVGLRFVSGSEEALEELRAYLQPFVP